jgi:hypothetical protein
MIKVRIASPKAIREGHFPQPSTPPVNGTFPELAASLTHFGRKSALKTNSVQKFCAL